MLKKLTGFVIREGTAANTVSNSCRAMQTPLSCKFHSQRDNLSKQQPNKNLLTPWKILEESRRNVNFIQVGPNKFLKIKRAPAAGTLISSDVADEDTDSHTLTRKSNKTDISYPDIVADSPYENNYDRLYYDGIHYSELPILICRAQWNNLICATQDKDYKMLYYTSARLEGYKNAKKKSPVVNQQIGTVVARRLLKMGVKCARVVLNGVGPGRESVVRGLFLGGLNIASLTDSTYIGNYYTMRRPRKRRRV